MISKSAAVATGMTVGVVAVVGVLALAGGLGMGEQPVSGAGGVVAPADIPEAILNHEARGVYLNYCAGCHGEYLNGGSAGGFLDGVWRYGGDAWLVNRSIKFGIAADGMPAYEGALSEQEIRQLVDYIRGVPEGLGIEPPAIPEVIGTRDYELKAEVVIDGGLETPWAIAFIDEETALITEKPGRLRVWRDGELETVRGIPESADVGQGGLLDVAIDPEWDAGERWVYLAFTHGPEGRRGPTMTKVVRGKIEGGAWTSEQTVFEADRDDYIASGLHFGSRIAFDNEGMLYFAIGERGRQEHAQDLTRPNGKMYRVNRDGTVPSDNPFVGRGDGVYGAIYSYGHRNPQGVAFASETGRLWSTEHGPMGGDELNLVRAGLNYGWPEITYGVNYNGAVITEETRREGMAQPSLYWTPSIAVCGLDVYEGGPLEAWEGNLLAGALAHEEVRRLVVVDDRVIHQEVIFKGYGRVRDVEVSPEGAVYIVLNRPDRVVKLTKGTRVWRQ